MKPLYTEIPYVDPATVYQGLADHNWHFWLDSSGPQDCPQNRYSFIGLDPFFQYAAPCSTDTALWQAGQQHPAWQTLEQLLGSYALDTEPTLPPFQGGIIGYLSYDLTQTLEYTPHPQQPQQDWPCMVLAAYDLLLSFDHQHQKAWLISSGLPANNPSAQRQRAQERLRHGQSLIQPTQPRQPQPCLSTRLQAHTSRDDYECSVNAVKTRIANGDIFEANLSQKFSIALTKDFSNLDFYQHLRRCNPAPFSGFFPTPDYCLASSSPERFCQVSGSQVETRPIKGTQARHQDPTTDAALARSLQTSRKDRAENIMIVDLMRNDLARVCEPHSVTVATLCGLETYNGVHHLVSVVQGTLQAECDRIDLLKATFPGGSITGAPKIEAMHVINRFEPQRRGAYCGCLLALGFDGYMDSAITIRSAFISNQTLSLHAGGAITLLSDAQQEYQETLTKLHHMASCLSDFYQ
jgi:para-aminobenzoate synthetase component 1